MYLNQSKQKAVIAFKILSRLDKGKISDKPFQVIYCFLRHMLCSVLTFPAAC